MKGGAAQGQMVIEAPRAEDNRESIVEMVKQMDKQLDKITTKFQASMAAIDKKLAKATEIAAEQDSRGSPAAATTMTATAMATHMQWRRQVEVKMAAMAMKVAQAKGYPLKEVVGDGIIATAAIPTMAITAAIPTMAARATNATTATAATTAASATATGGAGRTLAEAVADAKKASKAAPPPSRHHRQ